MAKKNLRALPSVEKLLRKKQGNELVAEFGHPLSVEAIRATLGDLRTRLEGEEEVVPDPDAILSRARNRLEAWMTPTLRPVINATGVILHTNLGRALLSPQAVEAMEAVAQSYSNLEYDLTKGKRGTRLLHAEELLRRLTGAEAALVVNNNAAAVLLALTALARRRRVVISRSQLIEIGGGFRLPEVLTQSGAKLVEVGTTNRVHLSDYQQVIEEQPIVLVLRAHRSNFRLVGFTSEPTPEALAQLAHDNGLPFVDDLGSGTLLDTGRFGMQHEVTVRESLAWGSDLVCFSGDKLLGGPQAGVIVGKAALVRKLKKHPLARALRADKLCLAGLSATLLHYLKGEAEETLPVWRMIAAPKAAMKTRAKNWVKSLGRGEVVEGESAVGGGSLPGETLPTYLLALDMPHGDKFLAALRSAELPIIGRLEEDRVLLDPRTVLPEQDEALLSGVGEALGQFGGL